MLALSETRGSKRFLWELTCRGRLIFTRKSTTAPLTEDRSCDLAGLKLEDLKRFSPLITRDVFAALTLEDSMNRRAAPGGKRCPTGLGGGVTLARSSFSA